MVAKKKGGKKKGAVRKSGPGGRGDGQALEFDEARTFAGRKSKMGGGGRIPAWVMLPVGLAVGWFVASWPGAVFGGVIGFFLWRSRA